MIENNSAKAQKASQTIEDFPQLNSKSPEFDRNFYNEVELGNGERWIIAHYFAYLRLKKFC